jgi:hypothetical protein
MLILTDQRNTRSSGRIDFQNPKILGPLQDIWKSIIEKLLFINRQGKITRITRFAWSNFTLTALIKFALGATTGASIITTRQRGSVIPQLKAYFRKPFSDRQILADLMAEFTGDPSGIQPLEELLYEALKDNEPIPMVLALSLLTIRCNKNGVRQDMLTISKLFTDLFDPKNPSMAVAQLVFATAGVFQKSNGQIPSETWGMYTAMQRKYLDAGGLYYLPNQPKYEAGYIDAYTLVAVQKLGETSPTLFAEYIVRALEGQPAPSLAGLLGEADGLAIVGKQPQLALAAMQPLVVQQDSAAIEIFSKVLARIRLYYPDLLDNYLRENNAPVELVMKVQTTVVTENLWADFLISRVGNFMSEVLFIPAIRDLYLSAFQRAKTATSLEDWLVSTVKLVINFIYGKVIL